jgi:hypothetical protein
MNKKLTYLMFALSSIASLIVFGMGVTHVQAQEPTPVVDYGTCIKCHEDLYFLHDTGNWFCIRESPMQCVDCHGGNPTSLNKEEAHTNRKAHPILNEDVSKCQECHPEQCEERVAKFDRVAGISKVLVAVPFQQTAAPIENGDLLAPEEQSASQPNWIAAMEILSPAVLVSLVLAVYLVHRRRQNQTNKKES